MHKTTKRFWRLYHSLPIPIQKLATENFELLKRYPQHPSLHFKKVGKFWSARVSSEYRCLALKEEHSYTWVWVGAHDEYERLLRL